MGRLWQTLILNQWQPVFITVPVESMIYERQGEYYEALARSSENAESSAFIDFMLETIHSELSAKTTPEVTPEVKKMLNLLQTAMSRREIQQKLALRDEKHFREFYLQPAMVAGLIEMTIPDKPTSRLQKYRLTPKGRLLLQSSSV